MANVSLFAKILNANQDSNVKTENVFQYSGTAPHQINVNLHKYVI